MSKAKLKDGAYAFLGMAQPVDAARAPNGQKFYYAVLGSVRNGDCELCVVLGLDQDLNECVRSLVGYRDPGKKRSFSSGAALTFDPPTDEPFCLSGAQSGVLKPLDYQDLQKAQVYLGLI